MLSRRAAVVGIAGAPLLTAAQAPAPMTAAQAAADAPDPAEVVTLWPMGAPGGENVTAVETHEDRPPAAGQRDRIVTHTRTPIMVVFRPSKPNGTAVLIAPGGGYIRVVRDKEGYEAARFLASRGCTCFVLFYRLPGDGWAAGADTPLQDSQRALRLIRADARAYGIRPDRIVMQGFSAGGHVAASLITRYDDKVYEPVDAADKVSARPDFGALIYPVIAMSGPLAHKGSADAMKAGPLIEVNQRITHRTPPTFIIHAKDDPAVPVGNSVLMADALKSAGVPVELHVYETGSHGFGLRSIAGKPTAAWPDDFARWLEKQGLA